ncbi:MAG: hypothetical protein ACRCTZ_13605 [Sarcina sp.]
MSKRPKPDMGLTTNGCPKADDVICSCGETLEPHSFIETLFGRFKYYYTCNECGRKYNTRK